MLEECQARTLEQPQAAGTAYSWSARQSHAAHRRFEKSIDAASKSAAAVICAPSELLDADSSAVAARFEALDVAIVDVIQGRAAAMADLRELWSALQRDLDEARWAESCEQYLRYALSLWREPASIEGNHDPARAVNALEVLCILLDPVW